MVRETIKDRMKELGVTQQMLSNMTGIEYTAINQFVNNRKSIWYYRLQDILDYLKLDASCSCDIGERRSIQKAVWLEMKLGNRRIATMAKEMDMSYTVLCDFVNGRGGMSVKRVEQLMDKLDIKLIPYQS